MVESGKKKKIPYEDFFMQAIVRLRDLSKSRGIHTVFSNFNRTFREYYGEDPVKITQQLVSEGKIEIKFVTRGVMIYLPGEGPSYKESNVEQTLAKILSQPTEQEASMIDQVIAEVIPEGVKIFPQDFLDKSMTNEGVVKVKLPGTVLILAPNSQTLVMSSKKHFQYEGRNPSEAKYIIYAYHVGEAHIEIPQNNQVLFKSVIDYEKYCEKIAEQCFDIFLGRTNDETIAESLTKEVVKRLGLKAEKKFK